MNAYDFDKTIYDGDSGFDLVMYSFFKKPLLMVRYLPTICISGVKYWLKKITVEELKSNVFFFLTKIKNLDSYLDKFVVSHLHKIKFFYKSTRKDDDIVISASLDIWIKIFCEKINIKHYIATSYDIETGKIIGLNCSGKEKIIRFKKAYPDNIINTSFSDSYKDIPLLEEARVAYVVKGQTLMRYKTGYFKKK